MEPETNELFDFFDKLSQKDKIHFANCMFDELFSFDAEDEDDEDIDDLYNEDEEDGFSKVFLLLNLDHSTGRGAAHIAGNSKEHLAKFLHDHFFIRGYIYEVNYLAIKPDWVIDKYYYLIKVFGKVSYDICYS